MSESNAAPNLLRNRPIALTWGLLVVATVLTTWVLSAETSHHWALALLFIVAAWKIRLVMTDFIELRDAPLVGRVIFEGWAVLVPLLLLILLW